MTNMTNMTNMTKHTIAIARRLAIALLLATPVVTSAQDKAADAKPADAAPAPAAEAAPEAPAAEAAPPKLAPRDADDIADAAARLGAIAKDAAQPLAEGEIKVLSAVVMAVEGRAQWRQDENAAWKDAAVDDMLKPEALIRTGRESTLALRVGLNATVFVDRNSRVKLPQIVQAGSTLSTKMQIYRGRADIKVDKVGLTNDFSVVTPSTTLAVRGTGFSCDVGALFGTRTIGARTNLMRAIEARYFVRSDRFFLSGNATSDGVYRSPAVNELGRSFGPPPLIGQIMQGDRTLTSTGSFLRDPMARPPEGRDEITIQRSIDVKAQRPSFFRFPNGDGGGGVLTDGGN
ncbi:MAG: hypothetical protein GC159_03385 [Phycisphaera sp.]|nr:hypothetical protein [Phycisphaera sp.]